MNKKVECKTSTSIHVMVCCGGPGRTNGAEACTEVVMSEQASKG